VVLFVMVMLLNSAAMAAMKRRSGARK
jgi:hypothetical protein